eukprot:GFYU01000881.1.p1 GENE.GFYU01000881.1~~GFYU01000881.1.p1  ORF type:complete len:189 (-),score=48.56 GFYU01000881.1:225-791(-)
MADDILLFGGGMITFAFLLLVCVTIYCVLKKRKQQENPELPTLQMEGNKPRNFKVGKKHKYEWVPLSANQGGNPLSTPTQQGRFEIGDADFEFGGNESQEDLSFTFRSGAGDKDLDDLFTVEGDEDAVEYDRNTLEQLKLLDVHSMTKGGTAINPFENDITPSPSARKIALERTASGKGVDADDDPFA